MKPATASKTSTRPATERQTEILEYMREYQELHGTPPSIREIGSHFGMASPTSSVAIAGWTSGGGSGSPSSGSA